MCYWGSGSSRKWVGEVSIKAIWDTGNPNHIVANSAPPGNFKIIFLKDKVMDLTGSTVNLLFITHGKRIYIGEKKRMNIEVTWI